MTATSRILRRSNGPDKGLLYFWCPGCHHAHCVSVGDGPGPRWGFNGDFVKPTFTPSILVTYSAPDAGVGDAPAERCHSYVMGGRIQFLGDCTHALAGQTVEILEWPEPGFGGVEEIPL